MRLARLFAFSAMMAATSSLFALTPRVELTASRAENISRSSAPDDWRDATRYTGRAAVSEFRQWFSGFTTTGELDVSYEHVPRFSKIDAAAAGFNGQIRQKFGLGAFAPAAVLDVGLHARDSKLEGDTAWIASAGLALRKRLTEAWRVGLNGDWQQHYARSPVFDTRDHRLFGTLTWDITPRLQLSHGNGRLWGDFTANAGAVTWSRARSGAFGSDLAAYYSRVSWRVTDSFGRGWVTYRVTGRVNFWWLELAPALGRDTSLPIRYESIVSINKVGVKYRQDIWSLQLLHRF
jgi:hypothetical protein